VARTKSRANGDGDVWPRKNKEGRIYGYRGTYVGPDGRRRYVSSKNKEDARRKLRAARADSDRGLLFDTEDLRLGDYLDSWLTDSVKDTVRQRTYERYESIVRVHIKPALGRVKLDALTPNHVRRLYRRKLDSGLAPAPSTTST
jgi:integrase